MPRIFLSYSRKDKDIMKAIKSELKKAGFEVWSDPDIPTGKDFPAVIDEQLRIADAIVTLWTERSIRSKWVYFEALMATRMEKAFPIRINKEFALPVGIARVQSEPFAVTEANFKSQDWRDIVEKLTQVVSNRADVENVGSLEELTWKVIRNSDDRKDFQDFITRYPNGQFRVAAQKARDALTPKVWRRFFSWFVLGAIIYAGLLLPYMGLWHDYPSSGVRFWSMLYFNFFMFFVIFGPFMVPVYCLTLSKALNFSRAKEFFGFTAGSWMARLIYLTMLILVPVALSMEISYLEVSTGYAPWQFSEAVLQTPVNRLNMQGVQIETIHGKPDVSSETRSLGAIFEETRTLPLQSAWETRDPHNDEHCIAAPPGSPAVMSSSECSVHMNNLQRVMTHVMANSASRSRTGYLYAYSFFFFAFMFMGTYFNIFFITRFPNQMSRWLARLSPWSSERYSQILRLLGLQLAFISVWFVGRIMFQLETNTILPRSGGTDPTQAIRNGYYLFLAVYLVAAGFVITAAFRMNNFRTRLAVIITAVLTSMFLGFAFMGSTFLQNLQSFIGPQATVGATVIFITVLLVILSPLVFPNLFAADEEELVYPLAIDADSAKPEEEDKSKDDRS